MGLIDVNVITTGLTDVIIDIDPPALPSFPPVDLATLQATATAWATSFWSSVVSSILSATSGGNIATILDNILSDLNDLWDAAGLGGDPKTGGGGGSGGSGTAITLLDLTDTPGSYYPDGKKILRVKSGEDGVEFGADILDLEDVPSSYTGKEDQALVVNSAEDAMEFATIIIPETTRTVNWTTADSASDMQDDIDNVGEFIKGKSAEEVTFQFADGTYTMASALTFRGFTGGGAVSIRGNGTDANKTTSQSVYLDFSGQDCDGIVFNYGGLAQLNISNLKIKVKTTVQGNRAIYLRSVAATYARILYGYYFGTGTAYGMGVRVDTGNAFIYSNYVSNIYAGIRAELMAHVYARDNDDTGTLPLYGQMALEGSMIAKRGTFIDGTTLDDYTNYGGVIRT